MKIRNSILLFIALIGMPLASTVNAATPILMNCPWWVATDFTPSPSTQKAINDTGGVPALRRVFWKNIGDLGTPSTFRAKNGIYDIVDLHSPALKSSLPGSNRLRLIRAGYSDNSSRLPIALLVNYQNEIKIDDGDRYFPRTAPHRNAVLFPLHQIVLPDNREDQEIQLRFVLSLLEDNSPIAKYRGNAVSLPFAELLVHWRKLSKFSFAFPLDFQFPVAGETFLPTNNYTAEIVKHTVLQRLVKKDKPVLVMGAGGGGDAVALAQLGMKVTAVDVDPWSRASVAMTAHIRGVSDRVTFIPSNLFRSISGRFPLVVFVAPFPAESYEIAEDWRTYAPGFELIHEFMIDLPYHLTPDGSAVFLSLEHPRQGTPNWLDLIDVRTFSEIQPNSETGGTQVARLSSYHMKLNEIGRFISRGPKLRRP